MNQDDKGADDDDWATDSEEEIDCDNEDDEDAAGADEEMKEWFPIENDEQKKYYTLTSNKVHFSMCRWKDQKYPTFN